MALLVDSIKEYVFYRFNKINMIIKEKYYFDPIKLKNVNIDDDRLLMKSEIKKIMRKHNEDNHYKRLYIELMFKNVKKFNNNLKYFLCELKRIRKEKDTTKTVFCNICGCGYLFIAKWMANNIHYMMDIPIEAIYCACLNKQINIVQLLLTKHSIMQKINRNDYYAYCGQISCIANYINTGGSIKISKLMVNCVPCCHNIHYLFEYFLGYNVNRDFDEYYIQQFLNIDYFTYYTFNNNKFIFDHFKYTKWIMRKIIKKNIMCAEYYYIIYKYVLKFCKNIKTIKWMTNKIDIWIKNSPNEVNYYPQRSYDYYVRQYISRAGEMCNPSIKYEIKCLLKFLMNKANRINWTDETNKTNNENSLIHLLAVGPLKYINSINIKFMIEEYGYSDQEINSDQKTNFDQNLYKKIIENVNKNKDKIKILKLLIYEFDLNVEKIFELLFKSLIDDRDNRDTCDTCLWLREKYNISQEFINKLYYKEFENNDYGIRAKMVKKCGAVSHTSLYSNIIANVDTKEIRKIFCNNINHINIDSEVILNYYLSGIISFSDLVKIKHKLIKMKHRFNYENINLFKRTMNEDKILRFLAYKSKFINDNDFYISRLYRD
jgi:hypothetical protein